MTVLESTLEKLKGLPEEKVAAVADFIDTLESGTSGKFDDLAGCLTSEEADRLEHAIKDTCERIESSSQSW